MARSWGSHVDLAEACGTDPPLSLTLLEVVTRSVKRLHLDWPQEQEIPKRSKLDDMYLMGGRGEGPQRRSLPFVPCFCAIDVNLLHYH